MGTHTRPRHAAHPHHNAITTAITHAVAWVLTDHDDRIPNRIQTVLWFAALTVLFVCTGLQR
jgi:hypothetical protein